MCARLVIRRPLATLHKTIYDDDTVITGPYATVRLEPRSVLPSGALETVVETRPQYCSPRAYWQTLIVRRRLSPLGIMPSVFCHQNVSEPQEIVFQQNWKGRIVHERAVYVPNGRGTRRLAKQRLEHQDVKSILVPYTFIPGLSKSSRQKQKSRGVGRLPNHDVSQPQY